MKKVLANRVRMDLRLTELQKSAISLSERMTS